MGCDSNEHHTVDKDTAITVYKTRYHSTVEKRRMAQYLADTTVLMFCLTDLLGPRAPKLLE